MMQDDLTPEKVMRCAECTCGKGGIFCNWIAHGDPQVRQLLADHATLSAKLKTAEKQASFWRGYAEENYEVLNESEARAEAAEQERDVLQAELFARSRMYEGDC